jgi:hypothetical protein
VDLRLVCFGAVLILFVVKVTEELRHSSKFPMGDESVDTANNPRGRLLWTIYTYFQIT